jgi:RNA polymerase-interacting CarD/CdnL/TRCF family regulator
MAGMTGLERCVEAFERLKAGKPNVAENISLPQDRITPAIVSFEAGFDKGYLKKGRHDQLIGLIKTYSSEDVATTSGAELIRREKAKTLEYKERRKLADKRLEEALSRELLLVAKIHEITDELAQYKSKSNVQNINN